MTTFLLFTGVTESIVYFTKEERYSLNNAKILECFELRGNGGRTKRARYRKSCPRHESLRMEILKWIS